MVEPTQRVVQRRRKRPKVEPKIDEGPRPAEPRPCVRPPEHFTGDEATIMIEEWWFEHGHLCFPIGKSVLSCDRHGALRFARCRLGAEGRGGGGFCPSVCR